MLIGKVGDDFHYTIYALLDGKMERMSLQDRDMIVGITGNLADVNCYKRFLRNMPAKIPRSLLSVWVYLLLLKFDVQCEYRIVNQPHIVVATKFGLYAYKGYGFPKRIKPGEFIVAGGSHAVQDRVATLIRQGESCEYIYQELKYSARKSTADSLFGYTI